MTDAALPAASCLAGRSLWGDAWLNSRQQGRGGERRLSGPDDRFLSHRSVSSPGMPFTTIYTDYVRVRQASPPIRKATRSQRR